MPKYWLFILVLLFGCHQRAHYVALDDGLVLDKKSGDVFEIKPELNPPFKHIGNLNNFRKEKGIDKKRCQEK